MNTKRIMRVFSVMLLLALLISAFPMTGVIGVASAETDIEVTAPEETEAADPAAQDVEEPVAPEESAEASPPDVSDSTEATASEDEDMSWMNAGLLLLVNGQFIPYNPETGEAAAESLPNGTRAIPSGIYYSDVLGAHGNDLNGNILKAGGIYDSWVYGNNVWYPYSTGVVATTNRRVITSMLYCNDGPSHYKTESGVLAIPIRPSQESGWSMDVNGYGNYTTRASGVPTFKNESLYSKYVPNYSAATWRQINLIYGVARGMGGMTEAGNTNITAAASTLIENVVCGYIGLGSDKVFHGKPIMTNGSSVNQQMAEILARCEVYSKEKGLTGSITGDNTLTALKGKGYTPTDTTGWYVASGTASSDAMWYFMINKSQSNGNQIYVFATNEITFDNGKTVSLKKTTQGSSEVLACIQGNPLYTLQGAVYEIHQGSATGTVVETLTTNASGEASGTHKYSIGTKLYAVEKTAPSGYLLNTTPVELTVSAGSNVFNVADTPTFDPNNLVITKTDLEEERIAGAVFKAEFYASNWADSTKLLRTWYFQSNASGVVQFLDGYLASGYSSDQLFKLNGREVIPLGCVVVTEIKTANGYVLPQGNDGKVLMFIRQGGGKNAVSGAAAGAYWGDWSANPLNASTPLGIYKIENDADKSIVTAVNPEAYGSPFSLQKIDPSNIPLEGAIFRVDYFDSSWFDSTKLEKTWYFKTDSNGYFTLSSQYLASGYPSDTLFPTGKIPLGIMKVTEEKAPDGFKRVDLMGVWRMRQTESGSTNVESYWAAANGYTPTTSYGDYAYVLDSDPTKLYVLNEPDESPVEIIKTSTDGAVSGISFKVEQYETGVGWWTKDTYSTDASGKITLGPLTIGTRLRITEIVPENYVCTSTNPQTITVVAGANRVNFANKPIASLEIVKTSTDGKIDGISFKVEKKVSGSWTTLGTYVSDANGKISIPNLDVGLQLRITETVPANYVCTSANPQTITLVKGTNRVTFNNKPIATLEIVKTSTDGVVAGISFKVEKKVSGNWTTLGTYVSDANGKISVPNLDVGLQLRITETVPANYVCTSTNPQTITLVKGTNRVSFANKPVATLEIVKTSTDGVVAGISFKVEKKVSNSWSTLGTYVSDANGKISVPNLDVGLQLRITETVPENYVCTSTNPQTITLIKGTNRVSFANKPIATLEIVKTSTDGKVNGITFKVEKQASGRWTSIGSYVSDQNGRILIENLDAGLQIRVTEVVPENYVCTSQNPQTLTLVKGTNSVSFENKPIATLEIVKSSTDGEVTGITFTIEKKSSGNWTALGSYVSDSDGRILIENLDVGLQLRITEVVPEGYECTSDNPQTVTLRQGSNRVSFTNTPIVPLEIIKTSEDGPVEGISFLVEQYEPTGGIGWWEMGTYLTDQDGRIMLDPLPVGTELRITEIVPADSLCLSENPQTITLVKGTNTVNFINRLIRGSLKIIKVDKATETPLQGAGFRVFDSDGVQVAETYTDENGEALFEGLPYGEYTYREFEAPEGFVLDENAYPFSILEDGIVIEEARENQPKEGSITIYKVDENNRPLPGVTFLLEYSKDGGASWQPIQYREASAPVEAGYCTSAGLNSGKLTTGADGYAVYTGLCIDTQLGEILYRVTEIETKNGYSLLPGYAFEGSLSEDSEIEVSFTVVNQPTYKMPATGGIGFNALVFAVPALGAAFAALYLFFRKRKLHE